MQFRHLIPFVLGGFLSLVAGPVRADSASHPLTGHVAKVLPFFTDLKGHIAPSPSLFDRDAYQYYLREHTNQISGLRFDVAWSAQNARGASLTLRVELRGIGAGGLPRQSILQTNVTPKIFHHWTSLTLAGQDYKKFGALSAWRATLWNGGQLLGEQKSFLWSLP